MKRFLLAAVLSVTFLTGCLKGDDDGNNCDYDECKYVAPTAEIQSVKTYLDTNSITATQHCSGLFYAIDSVGTGATPTPCSYISVRYVGRLTNGNVFDRSDAPSQFFSLGNTITGWLNGITKIKKGGAIRLYIPPSLGYGSTAKTDQNGNVVIPANSILIFDVKLDGVSQ